VTEEEESGGSREWEGSRARVAGLGDFIEWGEGYPRMSLRVELDVAPLGSLPYS
jgi:hypothetical protein